MSRHSPGIFVLTLLLILGITLIVIGYQTLKAALANPADTLGNE
jgi:hypothetical protein